MLIVVLVVVLVVLGCSEDGGGGGGGVERSRVEVEVKCSGGGVEVEHLPRGSTQSMLIAPESLEFWSILGTILRVVSGNTWTRSMGSYEASWAPNSGRSQGAHVRVAWGCSGASWASNSG